MSRILAAAIQMTSTADSEANLVRAESLVREAARRQARFIGLPENFGFLRAEGEPVAEPQELDGAWVQRMAALARQLEVSLLLGSLPERIRGDTRIYNTSLTAAQGFINFVSCSNIRFRRPAGAQPKRARSRPVRRAGR